MPRRRRCAPYTKKAVSGPGLSKGRGLYAVDVRQVRDDLGPPVALVRAHPYLARRRAEVEADVGLGIGAHRLALHREPALLLRQAFGAAGPGLTGIGRPVHRRLA